MSGKYQAYPEYKDSGVEWLGQIPSHWTQCGFKRFALIRNGRDHKEVEAPDGNYPVIGSGGGFSHANQYLYDGESVLLGRKGTINKPLYIKGKFWTVDTMFYTEVQKNADARFLYYMALTFPFDYYSTNTALPSMTQGDLANHGVAAPSIEEQRTIAAFLDQETARIDQLIEKQQRLIELLKEKRQAVISHAVTKGLDPNVPMKDSGVEWLGQVPEHWEVTRLKFVAKIVDCKNRTPEYVDAGAYLVVRTTNVKNQRLVLDGAMYTDEENFNIWTQRGVPPAGSILFTREAPAGEVCLVPEGIPLCMGQRMMNFIPYDAASTKFLFDYLTSDCLNRYIESEASGSTVTHLRVEQVYNIPVVVPPQKEQAAIDTIVSAMKKRFECLVMNVEGAIQLLQERRTALISAAVTGKIDVRNWQPNTSTQANELDLPMAAEQAAEYRV